MGIERDRRQIPNRKSEIEMKSLRVNETRLIRFEMPSRIFLKFVTLILKHPIKKMSSRLNSKLTGVNRPRIPSPAKM